MFEDYRDIMTVNEVCIALSVGKNTLYRLLKIGSIKHIKVGKKFLIPKVCLIDFINKYR